MTKAERSFLVTPDSLDRAQPPADSVVVVVSEDGMKAVEAARQVNGRAGVFIGSEDSPALAEMRGELYEFR